MSENITALVEEKTKQIHDEMVRFRHELHSYPELTWNEMGSIKLWFNRDGDNLLISKFQQGRSTPQDINISIGTIDSEKRVSLLSSHAFKLKVSENILELDLSHRFDVLDYSQRYPHISKDSWSDRLESNSVEFNFTCVSVDETLKVKANAKTTSVLSNLDNMDRGPEYFHKTTEENLTFEGLASEPIVAPAVVGEFVRREFQVYRSQLGNYYGSRLAHFPYKEKLELNSYFARDELPFRGIVQMDINLVEQTAEIDIFQANQPVISKDMTCIPHSTHLGWVVLDFFFEHIIA